MLQQGLVPCWLVTIFAFMVKSVPGQPHFISYGNGNMISNKGIICKTIQFPSKQMNYAEQLSLWMNIHPFCVFCSDWRSPEVCVYVTRTNWSVIYIRYVQCQMRSGRSHAMAKAISRAATLVIYEPDWLGYPLLHYLMNWLYYLSLSLEREWCVCWARTGNHSVTLDARMIWLMQALSWYVGRAVLKGFPWLWSEDYLGSPKFLGPCLQIGLIPKLCPLGARISDYPGFS